MQRISILVVLLGLVFGAVLTGCDKGADTSKPADATNAAPATPAAPAAK